LVHTFALSRRSLDHDFGNFEVTSGLNLEYTENIFYYNISGSIHEDGYSAINLKYFSTRSSLEDFKASGFGMDMGYLFELNSRTTLGLAVFDLGTELSWETGLNEETPRTIRGGFDYKFVEDWTLATDLVHHEEQNLKFIHSGFENWWTLRNENFDNNFRFGVRFGAEKRMVGEEEINPSIGFSFLRKNGEFTYTYQQRSNFDNRHVFGYNATFGTGDNSTLEF